MNSGRAQNTEMHCQGHVGLAVHLPHHFQALETLVLHNKLSQSPKDFSLPWGNLGNPVWLSLGVYPLSFML